MIFAEAQLFSENQTYVIKIIFVIAMNVNNNLISLSLFFLTFSRSSSFSITFLVRRYCASLKTTENFVALASKHKMRLIHDGIDANSEFSTKHAATRLRCEQKHRAMCMYVWCVALTEKMFSWMYLCSYSSLLPQSYTYETTVHNKTTIKNNLLVGIVSIPKFIFHFRFVSFICFFLSLFSFSFLFSWCFCCEFIFTMACHANVHPLRRMWCASARKKKLNRIRSNGPIRNW